MTSSDAYEGEHLIADLHGCVGLDDVDVIRNALNDAVRAAGATLIDMKLHPFGPGQGVTGVALLAESHISIHTWPEHGYAALDLFLCGRKNDIQAALRSIVARLDAKRVETQSIRRGFAAQFGAVAAQAID